VTDLQYGVGLNPAPLLFGRGVARGAAIRAAGVVVPDIITVAWAAFCGAPGRHHIKPGPTRAAATRDCALIKTYSHTHGPRFYVELSCAQHMCETRINR